MQLILQHQIEKLSQKCQKFKLKGQVYTVGDNVFLQGKPDGQKLIARIVQIIPNGAFEDKPQIPGIKVQWYYKKSELDLAEAGVTTHDMQYITDHDLFLTDHFDTVFMEAVLDKCSILTIEEFDGHY